MTPRFLIRGRDGRLLVDHVIEMTRYESVVAIARQKAKELGASVWLIPEHGYSPAREIKPHEPRMSED